MPLTKVLWAIDIDPTKLLKHAQRSKVQVVCIRTTNTHLRSAIGQFHQHGIKVYGWRWPAVKSDTQSPHHFANDEANFVVQQLIPADLDGYIVDPESDSNRSIDDWNHENLAPLARAFCQTIKAAAPPGFHFGITSGCAYPNLNNRPHIPWAEFVAASDALYPQTYWRMQGNHGPIDINGGTPDKAVDRGLDAWTRIAAVKPIVPMAGELHLITEDELAVYGARTIDDHRTEAHFYADNGKVPADNLAAIANMGVETA